MASDQTHRLVNRKQQLLNSNLRSLNNLNNSHNRSLWLHQITVRCSMEVWRRRISSLDDQLLRWATHHTWVETVSKIQTKPTSMVSQTKCLVAKTCTIRTLLVLAALADSSR